MTSCTTVRARDVMAENHDVTRMRRSAVVHACDVMGTADCLVCLRIKKSGKNKGGQRKKAMYPKAIESPTIRQFLNLGFGFNGGPGLHIRDEFCSLNSALVTNLEKKER